MKVELKRSRLCWYGLQILFDLSFAFFNFEQVNLKIVKRKLKTFDRMHHYILGEGELVFGEEFVFSFDVNNLAWLKLAQYIPFDTFISKIGSETKVITKLTASYEVPVYIKGDNTFASIELFQSDFPFSTSPMAGEVYEHLADIHVAKFVEKINRFPWHAPLTLITADSLVQYLVKIGWKRFRKDGTDVFSFAFLSTQVS